MRNIKEYISSFFNKASETYDANSGLHKKVCKKLIHHLKKCKYNTNCIVDFGCGTGVSTKILNNHFIYDYLYGVDMSERLLNKAKLNLKDYPINFILSDFDNTVVQENSIDLAFSNMAFQWSINLKETFNTISAQLKHNSFLAFSIPISGTFPEINDEHKNKFYTIEEITSNLGDELHIVNISKDTVVETFNSTIDTLKSIKLVGANCLLIDSIKPRFLRRHLLEDIFKDNLNSKQLTYQIAYFILEKHS